MKIDDGFVENPKIMDLSDRSFRLHVAALCFCARNLTDGVLIDRSVRVVCALTGAGRRNVAELAEAGLWIQAGEGFEIKDYLEYNPDAEKVKEQRAKRVAAGKRGAEKRWRGDGKRYGTSDGKRHGATHVPRPVPSLDQSAVTFAAPGEQHFDQVREQVAASLRSVGA